MAGQPIYRWPETEVCPGTMGRFQGPPFRRGRTMLYRAKLGAHLDVVRFESWRGSVIDMRGTGARAGPVVRFAE